AFDWTKDKWDTLVVASRRADLKSLHELEIKDNHVNINDPTGVTFVISRERKLTSQRPHLLSLI
ncbi:hypothetical protein DFH28DRAFT_888546, partial [Melampsora americana]